MKVFVLVSRVPYPLEKGDKLRAYHQVRMLAEKHEVLLCCLSAEPVHPKAKEELEKICSRVEILPLSKSKILWNLAMAMISHEPYQVKYFYQRSAQRRVDQIIKDFAPDHIYCQLIRAAKYVRDQHEIPKTIDYMDAFSKGMERRIQLASFLKRPFFKAEAKRLRNYENITFEYFEHKTIISEQDRDLIFHPRREEIEIVPNGVDTEFFQPMEMEKKYDLVFNGNMSYAPNVDSAIYLVKEILPEVWKTRPETTLLISGVTPAPSVKELASDKVTVSGWVEDVRESYASAHIFIAPMQIGTGLQNKLLEAMVMKIPCITSPLANNALGATHNDSILIGEKPAEYTKLILELLTDKEKSTRIAESGYTFVRNTYDWHSTTALLEKLISGE